jgi:SAM-dependent methyltransferase
MWYRHAVEGELFFFLKSDCENVESKLTVRYRCWHSIQVRLLASTFLRIWLACIMLKPRIKSVTPSNGDRKAIGLPLKSSSIVHCPNKMQASSRQAFQGNLADPADASPAAFTDAKFFGFDVAGVGLGFHHFDKPDLASKRLAERLRPGGVLFIIDFVAHKIDPKDAAKRGIAHHGFSEEQIKKMFEDAGLTDFAYQELPEPITFKDPMGHDHNHGQGHHGGHTGSKHKHGEGHGDSKGHSMTKRVFIARASKL